MSLTVLFPSVASDSDSSEADTQTNSMDTATDEDFHDLDLAINMTPFVDWDVLGDLEMSSKSDDCLDEVFPSEALNDSLNQSVREMGPPVMLLSHRVLQDAGSEEGAWGDPEDSDLDPDPGLDHEEVRYKRERGFYDIGMLNIDTASLSNDTLHRLLDDRDHVNYLLHPDVKIEVLMAEQRKHMRIAQLLKLSQSPPEPPHPLQVIRPREGVPQGEGRGMPVPPNTPRLAKLKPDHCWIRDIPDSPEVSCRDEKAEGPPLPTSGTDTTHPPDSTPAPAAPEEQVSSQGEGEGGEEVPPGVGPGPGPGSGTDSVSESGSDVSRNDQAVAHHYIREDIPWNPGQCLPQRSVIHFCENSSCFSLLNVGDGALFLREFSVLC